MPRLPKADLDALKATADLARIVRQVVELKTQGQDLVGRCPFHDDDTPSFKVTPAKNLWHCFGCGAGGDVIAFVMKQQRVSFRHAVELLKAGSSLSTTPTLTAPRLSSPVELGASGREALDQVSRFYAATLQESPEALGYLERRGISSEAIAHFRLGYANRTLGLRLPAKNRVDGDALRSQLTTLGVFRESGHEHLAGSVVVPLFDEAGDVVGMYGRKVNDHLRPGTAKHLYLPGPHRGVFNVEGLASSREVILCESLIDALTFWSAGIHNVTSSFGASGFTDELLSTFKRCGIETVLVAYDNDDAGNEGAIDVRALLEREGFTVGRVQFPRGMDANEYARKVQPADKALGLVVERARQALRGQRAVVIEPETPAFPSTTAHAIPSPAPLAASALASASVIEPIDGPTDEPVIDVDAETDELTIVLDDRRYRVRGLLTNTSPTVLKVNLMVHRERAFFVDTVDVYQQSQRVKFTQAAARELDVTADAIKRDLSTLLLRLEAAQKDMLAALLTSRRREPPTLSEEETTEALALLKRPDLIDTILADFERCGVVGEHDNKLLGYLAMTSRKTSTPLAVVVQSSSAAGKSSLMDAVLAFCPDEDKTQFSAMTQQSLFYMGQAELKHQVLAIAEEEGAKSAALPLRLMQSAGEVTIAAPGKDPVTGRLQTVPYKVEGPVMLFLTTTSIEVDEELMNRCLVLSVDEDRAQTRAIHKMQRERRTLEGRMLSQHRADLIRLHQNAQRLLRPVDVVNPFADRLTFVDDKTRTRRDHMKYLLLIEAIAFVHQHQRPLLSVENDGKTLEYVEVTLDDLRLANRLAHVALGRSLDELPPHTRKLLVTLDRHVRRLCADKHTTRGEIRLTRREILDITGLSLTQLRVHLQRLVDLEYVLVHAGKRGLSFVYEVLFDGDDAGDRPHLSGLIDVDALEQASMAVRFPPGARKAPPKRGDDGAPPATSIVDDNRAESSQLAGVNAAREGAAKATASHRTDIEPVMAGSEL